MCVKQSLFDFEKQILLAANFPQITNIFILLAPCEDKDLTDTAVPEHLQDCSKLAMLGSCSSDNATIVGFMQFYCPKSCNFCGDPSGTYRVTV